MTRRLVLLLLAAPAYMLLLMVVGTLLLAVIAADDPTDLTPAHALDVLGEASEEAGWWAYGGISALVVTGLQVLFLLPVFARRPPRDRRGRSLTVSLLVAAFFAGLLTAGLGAAISDAIALIAEPLVGGLSVDEKEALWYIPLAMLGAGWIVWSAVLLMFVRGIWADRTLGRVVGVMLGGTLLEVLVVLPLDVMVRRRTDCYCGTGTFWTLVVAGVATLWLAGPGVVIALTTKRHRQWREHHCARCGYAKGPSPRERCPECGHEWHAVGRRRGRAGERRPEKGD